MKEAWPCSESSFTLTESGVAFRWVCRKFYVAFLSSSNRDQRRKTFAFEQSKHAFKVPYTTGNQMRNRHVDRYLGNLISYLLLVAHAIKINSKC